MGGPRPSHHHHRHHRHRLCWIMRPFWQWIVTGWPSVSLGRRPLLDPFYQHRRQQIHLVDNFCHPQVIFNRSDRNHGILGIGLVYLQDPPNWVKCLYLMVSVDISHCTYDAAHNSHTRQHSDNLPRCKSRCKTLSRPCLTLGRSSPRSLGS